MAINEDNKPDAEEGSAAQVKAAEGLEERAGEGSLEQAAGDREGSGAEPPAPAGLAPGHVLPATSPLWAVPLYIAGLVLLFLGERVLSTLDNGRWYASGLGFSAVAIATFLRFSPRFRLGGARREIENTLALLSLAGLLGVGLYFATTNEGLALLKLDTLEGATRERLLGVVRVLWVFLVIVATVPMVFAELALYPMRNAQHPESRRVRAAAASGLVLVLAAVYGALFVYSAGAVEVKADYSYFKTASPSEATLKVAARVEGPLRIVGFFPEVNEVKAEVRAYLNELSKKQPKVKVEFADRLLDPKLAEQLQGHKDGDIVFARGADKEKLTLPTVSLDSEGTREMLRNLDSLVQQRLMKLIRSSRIAYVTVGHGEINDGTRRVGHGRGWEVVRKLLETQNYAVRDLGLAHGLGKDVPEDADVVLVLGPAEPFADQELGSLERYLARGGKLFLALDPDEAIERRFNVADVGEMPGAAAAGRPDLSRLAALAGLEMRTSVLAHPNHHLTARYNQSDRVLMYTSSFSAHASVSTLNRLGPRAAVVFAGAGWLERAKDAKGDINFAVRSMPGGFADENGNFEKDDKEPAQLFNIAAAVTKDLGKLSPGKAAPSEDGKDKDKKDEEPEQKLEARIFVVADADAFTDTFLGRIQSNQALLFDAVRWLGGEESYAGSQTTEEDVRIQHSRQQDTVIFYSTIFGAPALILGLGLWVSRRSRRPLQSKDAK